MQILTTFFLFVSGFWRFSHYEQRNGLEHIMTKFVIIYTSILEGIGTLSSLFRRGSSVKIISNNV